MADIATQLDGAVACAPRDDVGPNPGAHSGVWLTSVMLALRPDLVRFDKAATDRVSELQAADATHGHDHIERFVASIVASVHAADAAL